jgi:hypothetical protein
MADSSSARHTVSRRDPTAVDSSVVVDTQAKVKQDGKENDDKENSLSVLSV